MIDVTRATAQSENLRRAQAELQESLSGRIVTPQDSTYETARGVWNRAASQKPAIIALCESAEDVSSCVRITRRHRLSLSVRGGGHDWTGRALCNEVVVDLSRMRQVSVDPLERVATVAGGALARDVASAAGSVGLVAALGGCGAVGMTGFTLGGGYGPLNGLYGFAADNLLHAEIVLADGRIVNADAINEPDLFWAIRGGGGNFGIVTSLRVRLHQVDHMLAGPIIYPLGDATDVLRRYAAFAAMAPDELGIPVSLNSGPDGEPSLLVLPLWNGDKDRGERLMLELQALGTPKLAHVGPMTYSEMLAVFDTAVDALADCHWAARTRSLPSPLPAGAVEAIVRAAGNRTSPYSMINWHYCHGTSVRTAPDATAFGLRQNHFMVEIFAGWKPGDDDGTAHRMWAQQLWDQLAPYALPSSYAAFLENSEREQAKYAYGSNGEKLMSLKRRYDPQGVFTSTIPLPSQ